MVFKMIRCKNERKNKCPRDYVTKEGGKKLPPCSKCGGELTYSPKWYVRLQIDGKSYLRAISSKKDEAIKHEAEVLEQRRVGLGSRVVVKQRTVQEAADSLFEPYLDERVRDEKVSRRSADSYIDCVRLHITRLIGHVRLQHVDHILMLDYIAARQKEKDHHGNLPKPGTINREIASFAVLLKAAIRARVLDRNPLSDFEYLPDNGGRDRVLTDEEIGALLQACQLVPSDKAEGRLSNYSPPDYLETVVLVALNTGLRKDGVLGLQWEHIDWERNCIVRVVKHRRAKGKKEVRVPMTTELRETLIKWRDRGGVSRRFGYVFPSPLKKGCRMTNTSDIGFNTAVERAGLGDFCFHQLRHTFVTHFIQAGNSLELAGDIVGHSSAYMTKKYTHLLDGYKQNAMQNFTIGGKSDKQTTR